MSLTRFQSGDRNTYIVNYHFERHYHALPEEKQREEEVIITDEGFHLIKRYEGLMLKPYKCPGGYWTIGYGRVIKNPDHPPITKEQAIEFLIEDIERFEKKVLRQVKVPITQNQLSALVSFTYNTGAGALQRSTLLRKLNRGDYEGAAAEFRRWKFAGGKVQRGLIKRRAAEAAIFRRDIGRYDVEYVNAT